MKIMAIKNQKLSEFQKNIIHDLSPAISKLFQDNYEFLERDGLETNPEYRQVIPYIVVRSSLGICLMQRCKGQGESRLLGKHYIGAGGHVEEGHSVYYTALKECTEELGLPLARLDLEGILITDGSPVDDAHVCVFGKAQTNYTKFQSPEGELHNAQWVGKVELLKYTETMEKWSQIITSHLL